MSEFWCNFWQATVLGWLLGLVGLFTGNDPLGVIFFIIFAPIGGLLFAAFCDWLKELYHSE